MGLMNSIYNNIKTKVNESLVSTTYSGRAGGIDIKSLSIDAVKDFASKNGLSISQDKTGNYVLDVPSNFGTSPQIKSFFDWWISNAGLSQNTDRLGRYRLYDIIDLTVIEASLTLDTYAEEALLVGFADNPLEISIPGFAEAETKLKNVLNTSNIFETSGAVIRQMCKYGDAGHLIFRTSDDLTKDDNIRIKFISASNFEIDTSDNYYSDELFSYKITTDDSSLSIKSYPWNFTHYKIRDFDTAPYGKSIFYNMTAGLDQLITLEALLALSRASKVERLVIKIPVKDTDPISAFQKISALKNNIKSCIVSDTSGQHSSGRTPGLSDYLFMPANEGFDISSIQSNIDVASTEDVDYFLEKVLRGTRLPKGYLFGEEVTDRGGSLQAQDLKFARALIPVQNNYITGLTSLCYNILLHLGYGKEIDKMDIKVSIERPVKLTKEILESYTSAFELLEKLTASWKESNPQVEGIPNNIYKSMLSVTGLPDNLINILSSTPNTSINQNIITSSKYTYSGRSLNSSSISKLLASISENNKNYKLNNNNVTGSERRVITESMLQGK